MITMNLSWVDDFLILAASGNFSRAAEERHMTQPAFSRRIRALEEWLGADLFDRSSQPATLTATGKWFVGVAQDLASKVLRIPAEARSVADAHSATLHFAATHALSFTFMPTWLREQESHAGTRPVTLISDVLTRCEILLLQGQVQFILCHADANSLNHLKNSSELDAQKYPYVNVGSDVLIPVSVPAKNGKAKHNLAAATDASPVPLLGFSEESGLGRILHRAHGAMLANYPTQTVFTAHLASVLRRMALGGSGMAWLPESLIADDLAAERLVEVIAPERQFWRIPMCIRLYRDKQPLNAAGEIFWQSVLEKS